MEEFEGLETIELADCLRRFYVAARAKNGERYSKSAFKNLRAAIQRYLTSPPINRAINIVTDREFKAANEVYDACLVEIRRLGLDRSRPKPAVLPGDVQKLYKNVFFDSPVGLQRRVFFEVGIHFGRRGREGLRELTKNSFKINIDDEGVEYVEIIVNELEKTKSGLNLKEKEKAGAMYSMSDSENCPVMHLKKYLSKLNPKLDTFYQRPRANWSAQDEVWYENAPLGKNKLGEMMKVMSAEGSLSQTYTNHCLRATCASALDDAGFDGRAITSVTGHKHVASLDPYIQKPSLKKRKALSDALGCYKEGNGKSQPSAASLKRAPTSTVSTGIFLNVYTKINDKQFFFQI